MDRKAFYNLKIFKLLTESFKYQRFKEVGNRNKELISSTMYSNFSRVRHLIKFVWINFLILIKNITFKVFLWQNN